MASLLNRARMTTSTTGTGTITLGSAVTGHLSFSEAGAANATVYAYTIEDGNDFEIGEGTYTSSGTTFSRDTVTASKISGTAGTSKINLSGSAQIFVSPRATDILTSAGPTTIASVSLTGNAPVISTSIAATYSRLSLRIAGASMDTATRRFSVQLSTNGGSSYDTTAGNYYTTHTTGTTLATTTDASILAPDVNITAAQTISAHLWIDNYQGSGNTYYSGYANHNGTYYTILGIYKGSTSAINGMRFIMNSTGNFDAGTATLYGHP